MTSPNFSVFKPNSFEVFIQFQLSLSSVSLDASHLSVVFKPFICPLSSKLTISMISSSSLSSVSHFLVAIISLTFLIPSSHHLSISHLSRNLQTVVASTHLFHVLFHLSISLIPMCASVDFHHRLTLSHCLYCLYIIAHTPLSHCLYCLFIIA